ncbi:ABC transporter ATP-binding protein [Thermodesulfobacteriota bacterium]
MNEIQDEPILDVRNLVVEFDAGGGRKIHAVSDVGFRIAKGETLGLVGESGCGKSSVARAVMQLPKPTSGWVLFCGEDLTRAEKKRLRTLRPQFQMIFQDSVSALNPRRKIGETVAVPLKIMGNGNRAERKRLVLEMLESVGVGPEAFDRLPFEFSGGQCQRIQIARALMSNPKLLICDEPVSALDVSVQAQIINLLEDLRKRLGLTLLFISHDLAVVKNVCDRVAVMYLGKLCEIAPSEDLYRSPRHPYTAALLSAIPGPDPSLPPRKVDLLSGEMPSPTDPPSGCRFRTRCPKAEDRCAGEQPVLNVIEPGHGVACHFPKSRIPIGQQSLKKQ